MLNCKQVSHILSEAQDRKLALAERLPLRLHLAMCQGCRNFKKQLSFLRLVTRGYTSRSNSESQDKQ